jgi:integrase/recombinase XerD
MVFYEASKLFMNHCQTAISLSSHTYRAYSTDLKDAQNHIGSRTGIASIRKEHLREYIRVLREECDLKESSIKRRIATLKLFFKWTINEELISSNPFDNLNEKIRLPKRLPRALDRLDTNLLKKYVSTPSSNLDFDDLCNKTAISLLLSTGIRVGELSNICIDDYSRSDRSIKIYGKGNRQRLVYLLTPQLHRLFNNYLVKRRKFPAASDKLFVTAKNGHLTPPRIRSSLKTIAKQAGVEKNITPHMLRHTCATQWLEAGLDIRYVQKLLGHHSISTTEIYTHVSDQSLREALLRTTGGKKR